MLPANFSFSRNETAEIIETVTVHEIHHVPGLTEEQVNMVYYYFLLLLSFSLLLLSLLWPVRG